MTDRHNPAVLDKPSESAGRSESLRRELGIRDLILAQILIVVVPDFFGTAVKAGPSHVVLWLAAIVFFFVPEALLVAHLNRLMPLEGGLYEWARVAFGDGVGFLVAWNLWLYVAIQVSQIALLATTYVSYAFGIQRAPGPLAVIATSAVLIGVMALIARVGLSVGKWVNNLGSMFTLIAMGVLVLLPLWNPRHAPIHEQSQLRLALPAFSLFSLSVFSKMTFGALSGFEYVAIFAGESRNPARNLARSILITAPIIALLYIFGTRAILAFVPPDAVDVIGPIPQALSRGLGASGQTMGVIVLLLLFNYLCSYTLYFSGNTRLPMVAGWDHLLPKWFTVLHPRYRTPVNSIFFAAGIGIVVSVLVLIGAGNEEAFALLQVWAFTFYGIAYLGLFAIPLLSSKEKKLRPRLWLQLGAACGLLLTMLFVGLSFVPVIPVASKLSYAMKVLVVISGANVLGVFLYRAGRNSVRVS